MFSRFIHDLACVRISIYFKDESYFTACIWQNSFELNIVQLGIAAGPFPPTLLNLSNALGPSPPNSCPRTYSIEADIRKAKTLKPALENSKVGNHAHQICWDDPQKLSLPRAHRRFMLMDCNSYIQLSITGWIMGKDIYNKYSWHSSALCPSCMLSVMLCKTQWEVPQNMGNILNPLISPLFMLFSFHRHKPAHSECTITFAAFYLSSCATLNS